MAHTHTHRWVVETEPKGGVLPARCACGNSRTFPTVRSLSAGYGGGSFANRERQQALRTGKGSWTDYRGTHATIQASEVA